MKYLINMISSSGKAKNVIMDGESFQEVTEKISKLYPAHAIKRVSDKKRDIDYFETIKKMGKK